MAENKKWAHCKRSDLAARNTELMSDYNSGMEIKELSQKYTLKRNTLYMLISAAGVISRKKYMQHGIDQGKKSVAGTEVEDPFNIDMDPAFCQHAVHDISVSHVILTDKASKVIKKHYVDVTELYLQSNECITGINVDVESN